MVTGGVDRSARERVVPALLWLIERLARRHEVHVFALHYSPEPCTYPLLGAAIHDVGRVDGPPGLRRLRQRARLTAALGAAGPFDVLHAYSGMPAVVATHVARRAGVPIVVTFDSGEFVAIGDIGYGLQRRWRDRFVIARTLRDATRVTVGTQFMAELAARHGRGTDIVPLGVDPNAFPPATRPPGPPWRLLRVGSLNRVKDYPMLLNAMTRIVREIPEVHLDIVGEDTLDGGVQALARTLDLESHVTFHGVQPTDRLATFYADAHVHVTSSRHEAAGVVVLEAACSGLPTVGTGVGYVADWADDRAVAVPAGDAAALADAVVRLIRDPARRERLASAARAWALEYSADWTAARFEEIYRALAGPRDGRAIPP